MVIRGRAPLRVSFGGGGTDVAPFCVEQGGAIIGSTINKYAYCSIVPREDDQIIVHSLDFDMTVKYNAKENFVYDGRLDLVTAAWGIDDVDTILRLSFDRTVVLAMNGPVTGSSC